MASSVDAAATLESVEQAATSRPRSTVRIAMAAVGAVLYALGWLLPHQPIREYSVVSLPLLVAEAPRANEIPSGLVRSQVQEESAMIAIAADATVEFVVDPSGQSTAEVSLLDCKVGAGCAATFAEAYMTDRLAAADAAAAQRRDQLTIELEQSKLRVPDAQANAGTLAQLTVAEFQQQAIAGDVRSSGSDWQASFDQLRGYQEVLAEQSAQSVIGEELDQLSDVDALKSRIIGSPAYSSGASGRNNLVPLIIAATGLLLGLGALAAGRKRFDTRPFGLRSGVPALVGRVVLVGVLAAAGLALAAVLRFKSSAESASLSLRGVADALARDDMPQARSDIDELRLFTDEAERLLDHPGFRLAAVLPGGSGNRSQLSQMATVVHQNLDAGSAFVDTIAKLETTTDGYPTRMRTLRDALSLARQQLLTIDVPFGANSAGERFRADHDTLIAGFAQSATNAQTLLDNVLVSVDQGTQYLVVVGSTSEPRAAMGGYFMVGTAGIDEGGPVLGGVRGITLDGPLTSTTVPFVDAGAVTVEDPDLARNLAGFAVGADWTTLSMSPRFDATSAVAVEMWKAVGGGEVAGVVYLDPITLRQMLFLTGPVDIDGTTIDGGNVITFIDDLQYRGPLGDQTQRAERQDVLRQVIGEVVSQLRDKQPNGTWLRELSVATSSRHLMLWTAGLGDGQPNTTGDLSGTLSEQSLAVSASPLNGKYDPYLDVSVAATTTCRKDSVDVAMTVTVTHTDDTEPHNYLSGSLWFLEQPTTAAVMVSASLPASSVMDLGQQPQAALAGTDGPTRLYGTWLQVERGATATTTVNFSLPAGTKIRIEPSGRATERPWKFDAEEWDTSVGGRDIPLDACTPGP
jgi:Protein of unknown function (DUF4012)